MRDSLPFWQWYGTRFVWSTIGNDYCPFCQGETVAGCLFFAHLGLGAGIAAVVHGITSSLVAAAVPVLVLGYVGVKATAGFFDHLYGWQDDTYEAVEEVAEEEDLEVERI